MKKLVILFLHCTCTLFYAQNMLILDTANNDPYIYRSLNIISSDLGFNPEYKHFYEISTNDINNANPIVFVLDGTFFGATARELSQKHKIKSLILQHIYTIIDQISNQKNKTIMVVLPNAGTSIALLTLAHQFLRRLGMQEKRQISSELESFLKNALLSVLQSDAGKSYRYDTSLLYAKETSNNYKSYELKKIPIIKDKQNSSILAAPLPLDKTIFQNTFELEPVHPMGFYIKNRFTGNQFFVVSASALRFADIQDPFAYNPVDKDLRVKLLKGLQSLLVELFHAAQSGELKPASTKQLPNHLIPQTEPPEKVIVNGQRNQIIDKHYDWTKKGIACGWLALEPYQGKEEEVAERLLKSGLNMLWLQLNPEWYLSKNAINKKGKKEFFNRITAFTQALKKKSKELQLPIPKLFVGMEMTGNLPKHLPSMPAIDIYNKAYSKIPNPLDFEHFWKPEVIDVLENFKEAWDQISSGIPLSGIFLDFEMYHAPDQTGQFTSLMDFSDNAWQKYLQVTNKQDLAHLYKVKDRVSYLMNHGLLKEYFSFLKHEAFKLGRIIKQNIKKILPEGIIAGYNITLPHTWFYKGIMAGLSLPSEPLILATFNNEFYPHYNWLKREGIHLYHLPTLLLSKLQSKDDFKKIGPLWSAHDGIWFNRISRLEESRSSEGKQWDYGLESTPLDTETVISCLKEWISKFQK